MRGHRVQVRLVDTEADRGSPDRPGVPEARLQRVVRGGAVGVVSNDREYTYVSLRLRENPGLALELSESLSVQRRYVQASLVHNAVEAVVIVLLCGLVAVGFGWTIVARPMSRLGALARRIGAGDLSARLELSARDEITELANEMNAMCDRLAEANRRVSEETAARIATLEQLRHADRLRTVGQLASGVAHELGTPLNVVSARGQMLKDETRPAEIAEHSRVIGEQVARMTRIIRQLLDFARRQPPRMARIRLGDLAAHAVEMLVPIARKHGVEIAVAGDRTLEVDADANQLVQAVTNLAMNGIQAMPRGGTLSIVVGEKDARPPPDVGGPLGHYRFVAVEDEGVGIGVDALTKIFEPFFTTKDIGEGTGLGLPVTWGIARDHGGFVEVESDPGRGSRFRLLVPCPAP
jgi:signal transduction histidine kinase